MLGCCLGNESVSAYSVAIAESSSYPSLSFIGDASTTKREVRFNFPFVCAYDLLIVSDLNLTSPPLPTVNLCRRSSGPPLPPPPGFYSDASPVQVLTLDIASYRVRIRSTSRQLYRIVYAARWRTSRSHRILLRQASLSISSMAGADLDDIWCLYQGTAQQSSPEQETQRIPGRTIPVYSARR